MKVSAVKNTFPQQERCITKTGVAGGRGNTLKTAGVWTLQHIWCRLLLA